MHILIIGGGISGLSCAKHLLSNSNFQITIVEEKAEIGHPQTRPGKIIDKSLIDVYLDSPIQMGESGCRRPWVAKALAQDLSVQGATIILRTRVISTNPLEYSGAGPSIENEFDIIVNTTKNNFSSKTTIVSEITDKLSNFKGGITTSNKNTYSPSISSSLSNDLIECWYHETIPKIEGGWMERMEGTFSIAHGTIDASFERGLRLAKSVLELKEQSSQQIA